MNPAAGAVLVAVGAIALTAASAHAENDAQMCRNGLFPSSEAAIGQAQLTGTARQFLLDDTDGCPAETARCRANTTSVRPGAVLLTGHRLGAYVCVFDPVSGNAGFVESARLKALDVDASPPLKAWIGRWRDGDNAIRLTAKGSALVASGDAYWPSAHPSRRDYPGGPNVGDLSGTATPKGNLVVFADASDPQACSATLRLIGDALVVADNQQCGGMNVSFSGVYRRR